jgi:hypothetical protein
MRKITFALLLCVFAIPSAFAGEEPAATQSVTTFCEQDLLGISITSLNPLVFRREGRWSMRGALGNHPPRTQANEQAAREQGGWHWGTSIGVATSIEEARNHDMSHKFTNLGRIPYIITNVPVDDLRPKLKPDSTPDEVVRARFKQIFDSPDSFIIEFEDALDERGNKARPENYEVLSKEGLSRLGVLDEMLWMSPDERGARFHFFTWVLPKMVGIVEFKDLLKLDAEGKIADAKIRKMFRTLIAFMEDGGTFSLNRDFTESLNFARDQWRKGPEGKMIQESRYISNPGEYVAALESYKAGTALSAEARDASGKLVAGEILFRAGNVLTANTVFHIIPAHDTRSDEQKKRYNYADVVKAVSLFEGMRLLGVGISWINVGMVSPLTEEEGGKMVSEARFEELSDSVNAVGRIDLMENRPFSLDEIPFAREDFSKRFPYQAPPEKKVKPPRRPHQPRPADMPTGTDGK